MQEILILIEEIYIGWSNYFEWLLGMQSQEAVANYKAKKKVCNKDCPLHTMVLGTGICDPTKTHDKAWGCGCVLVAKRWSDSECPLGKF
jgi:hypothetical protein